MMAKFGHEKSRQRARVGTAQGVSVARVNEGYAQAEVAAFLGVHPNTVSRWVCTARE